ncbi:MAG: GatB/YqeY domain-containing protein [Gemmobacter sp.]
MTLRDRLQTALRDAMKAQAADRLSTLRLVNAAIKDREIALRTERGTPGGDAPEMSEAEILSILGRLVKQRQESARAYEEGGRLELAEKELGEIGVIHEFLPTQLTDAEVQAALETAIAETGAAGIRDMGRVMAALKSRHTGQMDFGTVGPMVKARLG